MLVLSEADVAALLSMRDAIDALEQAFRAQSAGDGKFPLRTVASAQGGVLGAMPGTISGKAPVLGAKLVTFFAENEARGLHTHNAVIALFKPDTGEPLALLDGRHITEIRTAAASALATRALARPDARVAAMLGTGVQARSHVRALTELLKLDEMRVWGRRPERAETIAGLARECGLEARVSATVGEACQDAHIVCTVTSAREPILAATDVDPGTHINAVGFSGSSARELAADLVGRARLIVDSIPGALNEAGDILLAIKDGALVTQPNLTLLCDVIAGKVSGRQASDDVTIFESLGIALEDLACAAVAYERALQSGRGTTISL